MSFVTETTVPQNGDQASARASRGLQAWRDGAVGRHADRWVVAGDGGIYEVGLDPESCTCPDHRLRGETCKHIHAATVARAKTRTCDGCGDAFPKRAMIEVHPEAHDGMAAFDGDRLCGGCADRLGVAR